MRKTRASEEEIVAHFDSLHRGAGSAEERLAATATYFKMKPETVRKHLKFWWPGKQYLKEFGGRQNGRARWDRPTEELLAAMTKYGSVAPAAKALKTTSVTLAKALKRHGIEQRWVVEGPARRS
jgi:transcriptional regulator with GAF, ATPase, and Fis domain